MATTSSGFTPLCGSRPKNCLTVSWTLGMRVMPPTSTTSSIWPALRTGVLEGRLAGLDGLLDEVVDQRFELGAGELQRQVLGAPLASAVMNGRLISVWADEDSSILAFSAASFRRCSASLSPRRSMPCSFLNSSAR